MLDSLPQPAWAMTPDGRIEYLNEAWRRELPDASGDPASTDWFQRVHPDDRARARGDWETARDHGNRLETELRLAQADGEYRWYFAQAKPQRTRSGAILRWHGTCTDVHDRLAAAQELARTSRLQGEMLDASLDCIKIIDTDGSLLHINRSGCLALGVPLEGPRFSTKWLDLLPRAIRKRGLGALAKARKGKPARFAGMSVAGGETRHWDNILTPVLDAAGRTTMILCVSRDVTQQREAERRLRVASEIDELTGLLNRRSFKSGLKRLFARQREAGPGLGLMLIDLDHFKQVNDTLGHPAGDHLLRTLSARMRACVPPAALVSRLGGDEFAIALDGIVDGGHLYAEAERVLAQLHAPVPYKGKPLTPGVSIGCALYPRDARNPFELTAGADTALKDLKSRGRGGVCMFDPRMLASAERVNSQLKRARELVMSERVEPRYQPIVSIEGARTVGFEALLRWRDGRSGRLQVPAGLHGAFHDFELASGIGRLLRDRTFADMAAWRRQGLELLPMSIRVAPVELLDEDFAGHLFLALDRHGIPPQLVRIVVTEDILLERGAEVVARTLRLLAYGDVRVALDDFGTGHFSFAHLRNYPVHCLRIASDFIGRMATEAPIRAIVEAICRLGPILSVDVVAKGVDSGEQAGMLAEMGCRTGQGALFAAELDAPAAASRLQAAAATPHAGGTG